MLDPTPIQRRRHPFLGQIPQNVQHKSVDMSDVPHFRVRDIEYHLCKIIQAILLRSSQQNALQAGQARLAETRDD